SAQVRQWLRDLLWARDAKRLQRLQRYDPRRNGRGEILGQKRAERLIFPSLDVAGAPVINQYQTEDVVGGFGDRDRPAQWVAGADEEAHFQLEIEIAARTEERARRIPRLVLSLWPMNVVAAHDDGAGPAVIGDRQMQPVRHQRVFRAAQHRADISGM